MRTRNQSKQQNQQPIGNREAKKPSVSQSHKETLTDGGTLTAVSLNAVGKLLTRANSSSCSRSRKQDLSQCDSAAKPESGLVGTDNQGSGTRDTQNNAEAEGGSFQHTKNDGKEDTRVTQNDKGAEACSQDAWDTRLEDTVEGGSFRCTSNDRKEETDEFDWEDGSLPILHSSNNHHKYPVMEMTIEFDGSPDSAKRKSIRRASAEDKELAELVHKVHLLCLLGRGRLIDNACNDPLIQASLLSLLPTHLLKISEVAKLTTKALSPLVTWFHNNFRIRSPSSTERSIHSALAFALEAREGTPEEVAALSVALFRALNLTTRFVSILDVASLKPDLNKSESIGQDARKVGGGIFNSSTLMVARSNQVSTSPVKRFASVDKGGICETSLRGACRTEDTKSTSITSKEEESLIIDKLSDMASLASDVRDDLSDACLIKKSVGSKRKGDVEFEMQLEMALSATAVEIPQSDMSSDVKNGHNSSENLSSPFKRMKRITSELPSSSQGISTAIGSKKIGAPLYWAEIYCSGENLTGRWVHVDAVNAIIDGEQKVEAAVAACKTSLRYAIAFAGFGAKDVTRRYCMKWYKVASQRINSIWWDAVLAPMKELESTATEGVVNLERGGSNGDSKAETLKTFDHLAKECCLPETVSSPSKLSVEVPTDYSRKMDAESSVRNSFVATRASLEDMELETRALTEPLPTNQQAYRSHHLYAIERWLTKYEILYPKGPVLGFCSGHPVYPRTCVQTLHTKERWLREGLQVNADEVPAKVLKRSLKHSKAQALEADDHDEEDSQDTIALYGKWQTKPICLPRAINGIVPKNERGQVDVWSEKSLPPGTVHLRLPRVVPVARRLEIDFAPAMVGFEFRNGRSMPVFDGIVVCAEFKDAVLEAYAEEEERREAEEKRRNETQATLRWYQLLSSIVTRQRLDNYYGDGASSHVSNNIEKQTDKINLVIEGGEDDKQSPVRQQQNVEDKKPDVSVRVTTEDHEHVFLTDEPLPDGESVSRTKRCHCGFSIEVEEL